MPGRPAGRRRRTAAGRASRTSVRVGRKPAARERRVVGVGRAEDPARERAGRRARRRAPRPRRAARSWSRRVARVGEAHDAGGPTSTRRRSSRVRRAGTRVASTRKPTESGAGCARSRHTASPSASCPSIARAAASSAAIVVAPRRELRGIDAGERLGRHGPRVPFARGPSPRCAGARGCGRRGARRALPRCARARSTHANAYQLLVATILSAQCTDERVNMVTPAVFARYPTPADLAAADPEELEELVRSTGLLPLEGEEPHRDGAGGGGALRRRDPDRARRLRDAARRRAQDRQRGALGLVRPARPAGRHARDPAVAPAAAHRRGRPGEDRGRSRRDGPARGVGTALAPADRARPPGVRRPQAALRRVRRWPASARRPGKF